MYDASLTLADFDLQLAKAIQSEKRRQEDHVELIASENYASPMVMAVQNSVFTNKYAEGYPGKRYYSGCENVDVAERLAVERAMALFDCDYANVQPHAGAQANAAVFLALAQPGDTVMGMNLAQGGHLTHGNPSNFGPPLPHRPLRPGPRHGPDRLRRDGAHRPGAPAPHAHRRLLCLLAPQGLGPHARHCRQGGCRVLWTWPMSQAWWLRANTPAHCPTRMWSPAPRTRRCAAARRPDPVQGQDETFNRRLSSAVFPGVQGGPLMHVIAAKAVAFKEALQPGFKAYQRQVLANARAMAAVIQQRGYRIVSGGTDNHLMLIDLSDRSYTGKDADAALSEAHITTNKNTVPNDPRSPFVTSGLRIGTPAVTTRGFGEAQCKQLAGWLCDVLDALDAQEGARFAKVAAQVRSR